MKDGAKLEHDEPANERGDPNYQGHQPGSAKQEPEIKEESLVKMSSSTNLELSRTQADKEKFTSPSKWQRQATDKYTFQTSP